MAIKKRLSHGETFEVPHFISWFVACKLVVIRAGIIKKKTSYLHEHLINSKIDNPTRNSKIWIIDNDMKYYWSETRKIITRFRISDHQLSIETEMPKIPRD